MFTAADATVQPAHIHNQGVEDNIPITFALKTKLKASADVFKHINKSALFATNTKWDENEDIMLKIPNFWTTLLIGQHTLTISMLIFKLT